MINGFDSNVIIIGQRKANRECIDLCKTMLKEAKDGKMLSIAVVTIPKEGEYQVRGAGTEIDGLLEGTIAMHDSFVALLEKEQDATKGVLVEH